MSHISEISMSRSCGYRTSAQMQTVTLSKRQLRRRRMCPRDTGRSPLRPRAPRGYADQGLNYRIPPCVQEKLRLYATRAGIKTGPIFITRDGTPLHRSSVFAYVQRLARDARVEPEKCNPRCLRKLHDTTIEAITRDLSMLIDMTYDRLLEQEELASGWIDQW